MKLIPLSSVEERFKAAAGVAVDPVATDPHFTIEIDFVHGLSASQRMLFQNAALVWSRVITGDLPQQTINGRLIDDLLIQVRAEAIDGVGGLLGDSGPTDVRHNTYLPFVSKMRLDTSDLDELETDGRLQDVITHEMGHCLGIGTIWDDLDLVQGKGTLDPQFLGARAQAEYSSLSGEPPRPVPLENTGEPFSRDGHWREGIFANELMTSRMAKTGNPLSRLTVAALQDMGYEVDMSAADAFQMPMPSVFLEWHFSLRPLRVRRPKFKVASQ